MNIYEPCSFNIDEFKYAISQVNKYDNFTDTNQSVGDYDPTGLEGGLIYMINNSSKITFSTFIDKLHKNSITISRHGDLCFNLLLNTKKKITSIQYKIGGISIFTCTGVVNDYISKITNMQIKKYKTPIALFNIQEILPLPPYSPQIFNFTFDIEIPNDIYDFNQTPPQDDELHAKHIHLNCEDRFLYIKQTFEYRFICMDSFNKPTNNGELFINIMYYTPLIFIEIKNRCVYDQETITNVEYDGVSYNLIQTDISGLYILGIDSNINTPYDIKEFFESIKGSRDDAYLQKYSSSCKYFDPKTNDEHESYKQTHMLKINLVSQYPVDITISYIYFKTLVNIFGEICLKYAC